MRNHDLISISMLDIDSGRSEEKKYDLDFKNESGGAPEMKKTAEDLLQKSPAVPTTLWKLLQFPGAEILMEKSPQKQKLRP